MRVSRYAPYIMIALGLGIGVYVYWLLQKDKGRIAPVNRQYSATKINIKPRCIMGKTFRLDDRHLCFWGFKNDIPVTDTEMKATNYNKGSITLNEHPVKLTLTPRSEKILNNVVINRLWWQLPGVSSVISGYEPNEYFLLTDKGLWYSKTNHLLHLTNERFDTIFKYKGVPYGLKDGKIRKGLSKIEYQRNNKIFEDTPYWNWEAVGFIASSDINHLNIKGVRVSRQTSCQLNQGVDNQDILLITDRNSIVLLGKTYDYSKIPLTNIKDIKLGHDYKHLLVFHKDAVSLVENGTVIYTVPNIDDAVFDSNDKYSIYTIQKGILSVYSYPLENLNDMQDRVLIFGETPIKRIIPGIYSRLVELQDRDDIIGITEKNQIIRI